MTDRPIIFSPPMTVALLAGRKNQTRRILKPQPYVVQEQDGVRWWNLAGAPGGTIVMGDAELLRAHHRPAIGDRLYVREKFSGPHDLTGIPPRDWSDGHDIWYWADGNPADGDWTKPKPAWHMPRWASRITLTVTDVRVQRLNAISEEDAWEEGVTARGMSRYSGESINLFSALWDDLHGEDAWAANPWVVSLSFRTEVRNIDAKENP